MEKIKALESEVYDIKEMLQNDNIEVGPVINKLKSIKPILEAAAGNLLASGVASKIPELITAISVG